MARQRSAPLPALAASLGLHAAVIIAGLVAWPWLKPAKAPEVVPVTLVTSDDAGSLANAVQAPTPSPATTENPTPDAPPQPAAPEPQPQPIKTPTPPKPTPPKPTPTPVQTKAAPTPKPEKALDLDALAASLSAQTRSSGAKSSSAARGPSRPQTALKTQTSNGVGSINASGASASMVAALERLWNPDCQVKAAAGLNVTLTYTLRHDGGLLGGLIKSSADNSANPILTIVSERAERAVRANAPFHDLPASDYGHAVTVTFDSKKACGGAG